VPDTYQGTEFWDLSLVDPDNRGEVDFSIRSRSLDENARLSQLAKSWRDGRIKQALIARLLALRASDPDLLAMGTFAPLEIRGDRAQNLLAFERRHENRTLVVGTARCCAAALIGGKTIVPSPAWWADTQVIASARTNIRDVLQPRRAIKRGQFLAASNLLADLPFFVLLQV
jgi:maltooligosyltrehalose synthase